MDMPLKERLLCLTQKSNHKHSTGMTRPQMEKLNPGANPPQDDLGLPPINLRFDTRVMNKGDHPFR